MPLEISNSSDGSMVVRDDRFKWRDTGKHHRQAIPHDRVTLYESWGGDRFYLDSLSTSIKKSADKIKDITKKGLEEKEVQDYSEKALLLKESTNLMKFGVKTASYISCIGVAGALGLTAYSVIGMATSDSLPKLADHAASAGWGVQASMQAAAKIFNLSEGVTRFAAGLGLAGGVLETGLGIKRIRDGVKTGNRELKIKGALDIGTGVTWALSSVLIPPPFGSALFMGAALTKMGFMHRNALKEMAKKGIGKLKKFFGGKTEEQNTNPVKPDEPKNEIQQVEVKIMDHPPGKEIINQ